MNTVQNKLFDDPSLEYGGRVRCRAAKVQLQRVEMDAIVASARKAISKVWIGWLAGIIDGEGCVQVGRPAQIGWSIRIMVSNTDPRMVQKVQEVIHSLTGCLGSIRKDNCKARAGKNWKPKFDYQLGSRAALIVLKVILPYLVIKRERAELAIAYQERVSVRIGRVDSQNRINNDERAIRQLYHDECKRLNKRGRDSKGVDV